ncbi:LysR family transcriptional regulator [Methylobacterium aquaticum]|uniref:LysR family transcriptional regulator n=1 Tax=Methylobacterium aquaticum TaxID=270351 RepID=UPI0019317EB2|nr:LysR family transcriptional regulator [Methylobacterium aquaticum]QRE75481.1 LysR family transcriptional regulator [Methylobacterium aquaticum]
MELKWLEDFATLARTGSFSRSAEERHVTQSAFSRRIQALEAWLGVALIDRSTYPTTLTPEGREFRETAEEAVRMIHGSRASLQAKNRPSTRTVTVAALHTLALAFFPRWFRQVEAFTGPLDSRLLPDNFHACLQAIVEGGYDFLLTFYHPGVPLPLDPEIFPYRVVGYDSLVAVRSALRTEDPATLPVLSYSKSSFLGRIAILAQAQAGGPSPTTSHINENAMAEALKFMVLEGHGIAWLPRSLVTRELEAGELIASGAETVLEVRLYRNGGHRRPAVAGVWEASGVIAETMRERNNLG